ncbi:uncharacterized protein FYW61_014461 [Anableps anableps]
MGSGTSRGKKVAPACVSEVRVSKAGGAAVHPSQQATGPLNQHKVHCAQPEGHGEEGAHSDGDTDGQRASVRRTSPRRTFTRSKVYGLCPFSGEDNEDETSCSPQLEEPRGPRSVPKDVNKRSNCVFTHRKQHTPAGFVQRHPATQRFSAAGTFLESEPACDKQTSGSPPLPMPVILYDGSEEELMDTIERDFS